MKILFITTNLLQKSNSAAIRNIGLISGLLDLGHDVEVLTISVNRDRVESLKFDSKIRLTEIDLGLENFKVAKQILNKGNKKSIFSNLLISIVSFLKDFYFFPDHYKSFINHIKRIDYDTFDVLISSSDMKSSHYAALQIFKSHSNSKWIQIWGDPWYRDINLKFCFKSFIKFKERKLLSLASKIIYVSDLTCRQSQSDYPSLAEKMYYVPRSYGTVVENTKKFDCKKISILYPGIIGPNRDLKSFLKWNDINESIFHLNIFGNLSTEEKKDYSSFNNVSIGSTIDYDEVLDKFLEVDVLLMLSNNGNTTQIPGKFFDYLGSNLPILCLVENKTSNFSLFVSSFESVILISYEDLNTNSVSVDELLTFISKKYSPNTSYSPKEIALKILNNI